MGVLDVAKMLDRSPGTVRAYCRGEGLPFRREGRTGRMSFVRDEVLEWASRPEIKAMLDFGDMTKGGRRPARQAAAGSAA